MNSIRFVALLALGLSAVPTSPQADSYGKFELCVAYTSETYEQKVHFQQGGDYRRVVVENRERPSVDEEWSVTKTPFSASFKIHRVFASTANEIVVWGIAEDGNNVVEVWRLASPSGSRTVRRSSEPAPIGQPMPRCQFVEGVVGEEWIRPAERTGHFEVTRRELYRSKHFVSPLVVDPDGRFFLAHDRKPVPRVLRFDLLTSRPPEVILSQEETSLLQPSSNGGSLVRREDYAGPGRAYALHSSPGRGRTTREILSEPVSTLYMIDTDNDGSFDDFGPELPEPTLPERIRR